MKVCLENLDYKGKDYLDISFLTGDTFYTPGWKMYLDFKNKKINLETFEKLYINLMKRRFENPKMEWKVKSLMKKEKIVFCVDECEVYNIWLKNFIKTQGDVKNYD